MANESTSKSNQQDYEQQLKEQRQADRDVAADAGTDFGQFVSDPQEEGRDDVELSDAQQELAQNLRGAYEESEGTEQTEKQLKQLQGHAGKPMSERKKELERGAEAYQSEEQGASTPESESNVDQGLDKAKWLDKIKSSEEEEPRKGGFAFALPFAGFMDILDMVGGILDETIIIAIVRIILEIMATLTLIAWYRWKYRSFSNAKGKRNMIKYVVFALADMLPGLTLLPLETGVLFLLQMDEKTEGKVTQTAEKFSSKSQQQKSNNKNEQLQQAQTA